MLAYGLGYFGFFGSISAPRDAAFLEVTFFLSVLVLPLALLWAGVALVKRSFRIEAVARQLEQQLRDAQIGGRNQNGVSQPRIKDNRVESLQLRLSDLTKQVMQLEAALAAIQQSATETAHTPAKPQASLNTAADQKPAPDTEVLDIETMVKALDFPRNEKDNAGFRALRIARKYPDAEELLRASEDVLNLLSQEGIYMDDLRPTATEPREWRLFAGGARGPDVSGIGGISAPEALDRVKERKRDDQIFRDAALYFLRRFDIILRQFVKQANDAEIRQLAETRTGRAFMLLARASGMLD